jgi:hypothetical protein
MATHEAPAIDLSVSTLALAKGWDGHWFRGEGEPDADGGWRT